MTFASPGNTTIANPVWISDGVNPPTLNDPVAYVMGSTPQITATLKVLAGGLPANATISLVGAGKGGGINFAITTPDITTTAPVGLNDSSLTFKGNFSKALPNMIQHTNFTIAWTASINGNGIGNIATSKTQAFITLDKPTGKGLSPNGAVSARRLDELTSIAAQTTNQFDAVAKLSKSLLSGSRFNLRLNYDIEPKFDPFEVLDGLKADCMTLCELNMRSSNLIGIAGTSVMFVYARTKTWDGLSSQVFF